MKKIMILLAATSLLCGLALAGGNGAIKADLIDRVAPNPVVGWLNANVPAAKKLIIEVHLDAAEAMTDYDVWVKINGQNLTWPLDPSATLTTNPQGKGNAHVVILPEDVPDGVVPDGAETIDVTVVVKKPADKLLMAGYEGTAEDVALK